MSVLARLYNFVNGTPADADQVDAEFNQILNMLGGTSTTKNASIVYSDGTTAPLVLNQTGAGKGFTVKVASVAVMDVNNDGTLSAAAAPTASAHLANRGFITGGVVLTTTHTGFKSGALSVSAILYPRYIMTSSTYTGAVTVIGASFVHNTNTTVGATTIDIVKRTGGATGVLGTLTIPDSTPIHTVVTSAFSQVLTNADQIYFDVTAVGGTPPSDTSLVLYLQQQLRVL